MSIEPTHQAIIGQIGELKRHVGELKQMGMDRDEQVHEIKQSIAEVHKSLGAGEVRFAQIDERQQHQNSILVEIRDAIKTAILDGHNAIGAERERIARLEAANLVTQTQVGVWKAIINSKPVLAFLSALAAFGAWFIGASSGGQQ